MFNLIPREKALRTILLDEAINKDNLKMFVKEDGRNFLDAIALELNLKISTIRKKINSSSGLSLAQYPKAKVIIERGLAFYAKS